MKNKKRYTLEQFGMNNFYDFLDMKENFYIKEDEQYELKSSLSDNIILFVSYRDRFKTKKQVVFYFDTFSYKTPGNVIISPTFILDEIELNNFNTICANNKHELKVLIEHELIDTLIKENAPEIAMIEKQELEELLLPNKDKTKIRRI